MRVKGNFFTNQPWASLKRDLTAEKCVICKERKFSFQEKDQFAKIPVMSRIKQANMNQCCIIKLRSMLKREGLLSRIPINLIRV